jgi:hypothetical protein
MPFVAGAGTAGLTRLEIRWRIGQTHRIQAVGRSHSPQLLIRPPQFRHLTPHCLRPFRPVVRLPPQRATATDSPEARRMPTERVQRAHTWSAGCPSLSKAGKKKSCPPLFLPRLILPLFFLTLPHLPPRKRSHPPFTLLCLPFSRGEASACIIAQGASRGSHLPLFTIFSQANRSSFPPGRHRKRKRTVLSYPR